MPALARWIVAALLLGCGVTSCGRPGRAPTPGLHQDFILRTETDFQQATLEGARLSGARVDIERFTDGYRGTLGSLHVALTATPQIVTGQVGPQRVDLHVSKAGSALRLQGLCYPGLCSLVWSDSAFRGSQRGCGFELTRRGGARLHYVGRYGCVTDIQQIEVELPLDLPKRPQEDQAAWLSVFLMTL